MTYLWFILKSMQHNLIIPRIISNCLRNVFHNYACSAYTFAMGKSWENSLVQQATVSFFLNLSLPLPLWMVKCLLYNVCCTTRVCISLSVCVCNAFVELLSLLATCHRFESYYHVWHVGSVVLQMFYNSLHLKLLFFNVKKGMGRVHVSNRGAYGGIEIHLNCPTLLAPISPFS